MNSILAILFLMVIIHLIVLVGLVPYEIVWGGKLKNKSQMVISETFSIAIVLLMLFVVGVKAHYFKTNINGKVITAFIWIMVVFFFANTIGNLLSENHIERMVFTPLTFVLAILTFKLAMAK